MKYRIGSVIVTGYVAAVGLVSCDGGETVQEAVCPLTDCGGACVDTRNDPKNCGACGVSCTAEEYCASGTCTALGGGGCPQGQLDCSGTCVNTDNDPAHCGDCATACDAGEPCGNGMCLGSGCPIGQIDCQGSCIDPDADNGFCGASGDCTGANAGVVCADGEKCNGAGVCALSCQQGLIDCGGTCTDPNTDNDFCGASGDCSAGNAGVVCADGEKCDGAGVCALSCQQGLIDCGGICTDPNTDNDFCGASGNCTAGNAGVVCGDGEKCDGSGVCALSCQAGLIDCNGTCIDPDTSNNFCGATGDCTGGNAGAVCGAGAKCNGSGVCALSCQQGLVDCGGTCIDPATSEAFCGAGPDCTTNPGVACTFYEDCNAGACAGNNIVVIPVTQAMMVGTPYACGNTPPEYSGAPCGTGVPGFQWTDANGVAPLAISITVYAFWNCNGAPTTARNVFFNGTDVGNILPGGACACSPGLFERSVAFTSTTPFVPNGLNTVTFPFVSTADCEAYAANPAVQNTYGHVVLFYP